jgi:hypothetical protein
MDSPVNKGSQFETYITSEYSTIEITYRTINDRKGPLLQVYLWVVMEQYTCQLNIRTL